MMDKRDAEVAKMLRVARPDGVILYLYNPSRDEVECSLCGPAIVMPAWAAAMKTHLQFHPEIHHVS